jgi:predicted GH43/DUF377 family glycosyl hydrolase
MARYEGNPILKPIKEHEWESRYVFNTAVIHIGGRYHFFYRAMGEDMVSRLGYASSKDCYHIDERLPYPVFEPISEEEKFGCEDPRLTLFGDRCIMTYTAYGDIFQIGLTSIKTDKILNKEWDWGERFFPFPNLKNKNAAIFPKKIGDKYAMLHRLEPSIHISYSKDLREWSKAKLVMSPRNDSWDKVKIGAAGPPMEIDGGWLLVYHGVDEERKYRLGVSILDKENPEKVVYRSKEPILEPVEDYECQGYVPNVVFSCGSILNNGKLLIPYGCADNVIGVATFELEDILI